MDNEWQRNGWTEVTHHKINPVFGLLDWGGIGSIPSVLKQGTEPQMG